MSAPWLNSKRRQRKDFQFRNNEEKEIYQQVQTHVKDMEDYARPARESAKDSVRGYMALLNNTYSNRSKVFPPTIHAVTYARMALEAANMPKVEVKARKRSSEPKVKMLNMAIKNAENGSDLRPDSQHLWFHQNFDKILLGVGFRFLSYLLQKRVVRVKDESGKWKEKTEIVHDDIFDFVPDFFNVGVSRDTETGMFGGSACYWDRFFSRDAFYEAFDNGYYENLNKIPDGDWWDGDTGMDWSCPEGWVRVRYYWNIYKDMFYVCANGIPIRQDYILDYGDPERPHKFLPITSIHNDVNYDMQKSFFDEYPVFQDGRAYTDVSKSAHTKSFWSKSDPKLIQALVGFKNVLWGAAADHTKYSSVHFLMASAGVFDQINTANLYGVVPLRNASADTFDVRQLTQNSNFFNQFVGMDEATDQAMTYALGNDWRRAASEMTNEKATVAAIRQQVMRIRMNQNMKYNEAGGIKRHYRLLVNLIQQYYPEPVQIDLVDGKVPDKTNEEDIIRDPDGVPVKIKKHKQIPIDGYVVETKKDGKYGLRDDSDPTLPDGERHNGSKLVKMRPEYIRTEEEPEIYIEPGSTFAELRALERSLNLEEMQSIQFFLGLSYPTGDRNPDGTTVIQQLIPKEGAEYLLEKHAAVWEMDEDRLLGKDDRDDEAELDAEVQPPFQPMMPQQGMPQTPMQSLPIPQQTPISPMNAGGLANRTIQ